ncbi:MAG: methyltransferase domain-containing protein [Deltaproteobacteria bacterium]|nr:methyltransferase domain-containing protein [Deltaproteobacteria bacterium]
MRPALVEHLRCPVCRGELILRESSRQGPHVMEGSLFCAGCLVGYPIADGVPNFVGAGAESSVEQTTAGFATNWKRYSDAILAQPALNDDLLRDWIAPLSPELFQGRVVLDAGCGMGRWLAASAPHAPRALIGFDYSDVARAAFANTRHLKNVHVVRADIFRLPFPSKFASVCYSIGVVHHTPDPEGAFASLLDAVADDGALSTWVYGKENNQWIERVVSPIRSQVTSRLPDPLLYGLSRAAAAALSLGAGLYARTFPTRTAFGYDAYLRHLRGYPRRYLEHIVYDHLVPQLVEYLPKEELQRWATSRRLPFVLTSRNDNSWRLLVARSEEALRRWSVPA